jgi:hypothetical protein
MQRRNPPGDNILAQEKKETPKPRNFVAKNAKMGGAGQHKDKKKEQKQGIVKHKKPFAEGERTMSRAAKGNEKYGKDGMKALAKAGREGASEKKLDAIRDKHDNYNEEWSKKYKSSINCSHPKGFSQKAHCAGKKKHTESMMTMEATCPDCGMCQTHGNVMEIKKGAKDSNGYTSCWSGYHAAGTKKSATTGKQVRNCVPNEGIAEVSDELKNRYVSRASDDYGSANFAARASKSHPGLEKYSQDQEQRAKKRAAGLNRALSDKRRGVSENPDWYNDEANSMSSAQLKSLYKHAMKLRQAVKKMQAQGDTLEPWQQSKVTKAADYLDAVFNAVDDEYDMGEQTNLEGVGIPFRGVGGAFNRGDDERHDLDVPRPSTQVWALKINGQVDGNNVFSSKDQALKHRLNLLAKNPELEIGLVTKGGVPEDAYMESLQNMLERSVSQAQHNLMVGVAHNPAFAQKVKVKQKVGQEFANADQGHDISKLPIRVPKKK